MKSILRRHNIFLKFFLCNICILLVPLLVSLLAYSVIDRAMRESTFTLNRNQLIQTSSIIDERLSAMETTVAYLCTKATVDRMIYRTSTELAGNLENYRTEDMKRTISSHMLFNNMIHCVYVFLNGAEMVISPYVSSGDPGGFYDTFLRIDGLDYDVWAEQYLYRHHSQHYFTPKTAGIGDGNTELFYYIQSIPVEPTAVPEGAVLVTLRKESLNRILRQQLSFTRGCWAAISDPDGNIITSIGDWGSFGLEQLEPGDSQFLFDNRQLGRQFVTSIVGGQSGWRITYAMPYDVTMAKVHEVRNILFTVMAAAFLIGTAIVIYLAYFNSRPLELLSDVMKGTSPSEVLPRRSAYPLLIGSAREMVANNTSLRQEVERQLPLVVTCFFQKLLRGAYTSIGEVAAILDQLGFDYAGKQVCVMIFKTSGYYDQITGSIFEEVSVYTAILKEAVSRAFGEGSFVYDSDIDKVVAIAFRSAEESETLRREIETRYHEIRLDLGREGAYIDFYIYVGGVCRDILDAGRSYNEAKSVMNGKQVSEKKILYFTDTDFTDNALYYPTELEIKLLNMLRSGNAAGVTEIMTSIYYQNVVVRRLSGAMAKSLYYDIGATLIKFCHGLQDEAAEISDLAGDLPQYYDACASLEEGLDRILNICLLVCGHMEEKKKSHNTHLAQRLIERISVGFSDSGLTVVGLADEFGMNATYLSTLFREQTGSTFSDYVESLRIKKAGDLLIHTALRIEDIALEVGYNSAYTFRRAFKRVTGLSPTEKRHPAVKETDA